MKNKVKVSINILLIVFLIIISSIILSMLRQYVAKTYTLAWLPLLFKIASSFIIGIAGTVAIINISNKSQKKSKVYLYSGIGFAIMSMIPIVLVIIPTMISIASKIQSYSDVLSIFSGVLIANSFFHNKH